MEVNKNFTLAIMYLILIAVAFGIIVLGFILMTGSSTEVEFNPDIFSTRRITVGPMVSFFGFLFMIFAILFKPKAKK
jgi:NADH:ubiquinone oxidoreductase subunit 2 (subunit N)